MRKRQISKISKRLQRVIIGPDRILGKGVAQSGEDHSIIPGRLLGTGGDAT